MSREVNIALALSGGSARGWAHIGALRALGEAGIAVGAVAGTSMGAIAALAFAAGKLDVLEAIARGATRGRVLGYLDPHWRRGAWLGGRRIARTLDTHFGARRLEELPLPVALVAADLATGAEVRLTHGPAVAAARASIAIPGLFRPVVLDGRTLIDGGMVANLPLGAARAIAPGLPLVAVDVMGDYAGHAKAAGRRTRSSAGIGHAAFLMLIAAQTRLAAAIDPPGVLVTVPLGHIGLGAFTCADALIGLGYEATRAALPAIRAACATPA